MGILTDMEIPYHNAASISYIRHKPELFHSDLAWETQRLLPVSLSAACNGCMVDSRSARKVKNSGAQSGA